MSFSTNSLSIFSQYKLKRFIYFLFFFHLFLLLKSFYSFIFSPIGGDIYRDSLSFQSNLHLTNEKIKQYSFRPFSKAYVPILSLPKYSISTSILLRSTYQPQSTESNTRKNDEPINPTIGDTEGSMIYLKDLELRTIDRTLISEVNWKINMGERVGIVGANGAGKSTLLSTIAVYLHIYASFYTCI